MAIFIYPQHIATRGRLDGEYGIATRGYIICPDLVSRFPVFGEVGQAQLFGLVDEHVLEAQLHGAGLTAELRIRLVFELATVVDAGGETAVVEEAPGEGSWRRSGEPC